ncbi:N-acetylmuramoyl-L-alanine amidase [Actinophytocola sp. NPDC049390]|uniref:N-acetylmuramoyl-L-alanine amidase n=1 Tax=Actinophytocola sp. NPDC049390 TaxID=3363894 RepID=UPI0037878E3F
MPGVEFLGIANNGSMSTWDIVCVHTIVGYQSGGNAAHFTTGASGRIVQARDTRHRSAANLNGNWHVIAIENEDHGSAYGAWSGSNVPRFTAAQAEAIAKILVWAHRAHGIPLTLVPDSKVGRRGIAYHRQGCDPYRVAGGELWSSAYGKVCPGDRRITQLINEIIPRARALASGTEDDMTEAQAKQLDYTMRVAVENQSRINEANAALGKLATRLTGIEAKLAEVAAGGGTVDVLALASALADEQDRRARDGLPNTGPVS